VPHIVEYDAGLGARVIDSSAVIVVARALRVSMIDLTCSGTGGFVRSLQSKSSA
jgi:hypothetical protein